jgi:hypothetical protein
MRCLVPLEQSARGRYRSGELGFIDLFASLVCCGFFMANASHDITIVGMLLMGLRVPVARMYYVCGF